MSEVRGDPQVYSPVDLSKSDLIGLMELSHPEIKVLNFETKFPATEAMFQRLSIAERAQIEANVATRFGAAELDQLMAWKKSTFQHYRREILRYGPAVLPEVFAGKIALTTAQPPAEVHSMIRQEHFVGDLYSCDMVVDALHLAGTRFDSGEEYLEFGCSSAPLLRTLSAAYPDVGWYGCDPVAASIDWAKTRFPRLNLSCSPQWPKLGYADQQFAAAFAISIWSHFSQRAGLAWFEEMHRVIRPGGHLMFTTHGYRSLYYYLTQGTRDPQTVAKLFGEVTAHQYAFHPIFQILNIEDSGLELGDWGDCYLTCDWVVSRLGAQWELASYEPGRNQINQDVYVMRRR